MMTSEQIKRIYHTVMEHKEELGDSIYPHVLLRMLNILANTLLIGFGVIGAFILFVFDGGPSTIMFSHQILTTIVGSYLLFIHYSFIGYFDKIMSIDMDDDPSKQYLLRHKVMLYFFDWFGASLQLRRFLKPFFLISMVILIMAACGYAYGIVIPTTINVLISLTFMLELSRMEINIREGYKEWKLQKEEEENAQ